ncbi:hypothetical protein CFC21_043699 [Triticum aestivum]|uniref:Dirigent protein n=2 Tax=Triticum aestivum TaxID=4565 RepID=A0A9R1FP69_WHEAT|nr:uncharacterized protein LOC119279908 [Triticum dicoccoides]KAF7032538.1 hypothetical protein CFC21_043699 [Triticum aestivum]CDM85899.1 unnamed protein product [Triticum aestivum]
MAAKDLSYVKTTTPLDREIQQKEVSFHLYMFQTEETQRIVIKREENQRNSPSDFEAMAVQEWPIRDGPTFEANIVAHAVGLHFVVSRTEAKWFICFNIVFTDERLRPSNLKVLRTLVGMDGEWSIIGGTGKFAFVQGVATYKVIEVAEKYNVKELRIRALCLTFLPKQVLVTKIGPWGGNGGKEFDIIESAPQHLESVTIRSGVAIDSIAFSYINQAGKKQTLGPWGGDGELTDTITFAPLEIVKEVSGTTGTFGGDTIVTSVTFVTNVRTYGPFGKPNGTAFSVPLTDTNVVGFFVRAGRPVNAIGVYARPSVQNY